MISEKLLSHLKVQPMFPQLRKRKQNKNLDQKKAIQSALPRAWNILHSLKDDKQFDDYLKIAQLSKSIDTASVENFVIVSKRKPNG
ncbi:Proteasome adapter and scaffold protein [Trichinella spiralis]|uniref:Proteasome adapter and scaffold protein n=1 Tax=Trichinella spiralis TaxID=6334 RepID=A0ABR3KFW5_TRISP